MPLTEIASAPSAQSSLTTLRMSRSESRLTLALPGSRPLPLESVGPEDLGSDNFTSKPGPRTTVCPAASSAMLRFLTSVDEADKADPRIELNCELRLLTLLVN